MVKCNIEDCENESDRTLSRQKLAKALQEENLTLDLKPKATKAKICKEHYRRLKKHIKKQDKIERLRWQ